MKILIGSPVYQKPKILKEFLVSLKDLENDSLEITYIFIDDNVNSESSKMLYDFKKEIDEVENNKVNIVKSNFKSLYICDKNKHRWNKTLINKVALFKNSIIEEAIKIDVDYLFLIDSDLILNKRTLIKLIEDKKEIVANIFWTKWKLEEEYLPQVWMKDDYTFYNTEIGEKLDDFEKGLRKNEFLEILKVKGLYKVGGVSGAILLSREALLRGVNFNPLYNVSYYREDRHFSLRAVALGLELYVDTCYPIFHIYREEDLDEPLMKYKFENR